MTVVVTEQNNIQLAPKENSTVTVTSSYSFYVATGENSVLPENGANEFRFFGVNLREAIETLKG